MAREETLEGESALREIVRGEQSSLAALVDERERHRETTGLDARTFGLVKLAALIGSNADHTSYAWHMANALAEGATPEDIVGTLRAVTPQIGHPKAIAATEAIIGALDLEETLRSALLELERNGKRQPSK